MRKVIIALVVGLGFSAIFAGNAFARETYLQLSARLVEAGNKANSFAPAIEAALLELVNAHRLSIGRKVLANNGEFQFAARAQAADLLGQGRVGHVASTGTDFDGRMRAVRGGALVLPAMAENAARISVPVGDDKALARRLVAQWLASPPHKHELESADYVTVATGVIHARGKVYADMIFVGPDVKTNMNRGVEPMPKAKKKPGLY